MLQNWRANVDMNACARYMAKYVSKCEPHSKAMSTIYADCVNKFGSDSSPKSAFRTAMIKVVGERDFGAQDIAHILQSVPLYSCTYNFVTLALDDMHRAQYQDGFQNIMQMNLLEFVSKYTVKKTIFYLELMKSLSEHFRHIAVIPKVIIMDFIANISYSNSNHGEQVHKMHGITFQNVMKHKLLHNYYYRQFLNTNYAKQHIATIVEELHRAELYECTENVEDD